MKRKDKAPDTRAGTAEVLDAEGSEDFGRRRDIETADEPVEEHDRRNHDQDAEAERPV